MFFSFNKPRNANVMIDKYKFILTHKYEEYNYNHKLQYKKQNIIITK